jgi:hypothetical protein
MGWAQVGRVPVGARPTSPAALVRMARARVPAGKWSLATRAGEPAAEVLADEAGLEALLASVPAATGLRTRRTPAFLRWRYTGGPIAYRALVLDGDLRRGLVLFRLRERGEAVEATIGDVLVPASGADRATRRLLAAVAGTARPDYLIATVSSPRHALDQRLVPMPGQGPILTWRALCRTVQPQLADWSFSLGDIELL